MAEITADTLVPDLAPILELFPDPDRIEDETDDRGPAARLVFQNLTVRVHVHETSAVIDVDAGNIRVRATDPRLRGCIGQLTMLALRWRAQQAHDEAATTATER